MRQVALWTMALTGSLALADTLDRTHEPFPLLITRDTDMSDTVLVDNHPSRPAVIVINAKLKLGGAQRAANGVTARPDDPGIDKVFDGKFLAKQKIDFSHHDFARAMVVCMGSFELSCPTITADTCVLVLSEADGTYGVRSKVDLGIMSGFRFGVLATGQRELEVSIGEAHAALWPSYASGAGHAFYANEARFRGQHMRLTGCKVRIGKSRGTPMTPNVRDDHVTAKFKGAWDVDYECLDDQNPCGALDEFESSGRANIRWKHPGGDAQCGIFIALRCGDGSGFGKPNGRFLVSGEFDTTLAPEANVRAIAFHMKEQHAFFSGAKLIGKAKPDIYGGLDSSGLTLVSD